MSDEIFDTEDDVGADEPGERKVGVLSGLAIQILKWVAIVIGAVLFVVTVVVITLNILQGDEPQGQVFPTSETFTEVAPIYSWFGGVGEIRGTTRDGATFIADIQLGYEEGNARVQAELSQRVPQLRDLTRSFLAQRTAADLNPANETELKQDLRERLNAMMTDRPVREVLFDEFQVVGL